MEVVIEHDAARYVAELREAIDAALPELVALKEPDALYAPVRYVLAGQGKRVRPIVVLLVAELYGVAQAQALPAALAVEVFHAFTLVHDDIMDHADERRGRPTVHRRWDTDTAILAGDFLMALSYDLLARIDTPALSKILRAYFAMVARLCEGQTLDKRFEQDDDVSVEQYLHMIDCKTGALLEIAFVLGGMLGAASPEDETALRALGHDVGRAFQIQDDLLDLIAADDRWGKPVGGDLIEGKKTYLLLRALERSAGREHAWFRRIVLEGGLPPAAVPEARRRMERLGVLDEARTGVQAHTTAALERVAALPAGPARDVLAGLIQRLQARMH